MRVGRDASAQKKLKEREKRNYENRPYDKEAAGRKDNIAGGNAKRKGGYIVID